MVSRRGRILLVGLAGALAVAALVGCEDGAVVRVLVPRDICEQEPDQQWTVVRPLWGRRLPTAGVWAREDLAVIVGRNGLAMTWTGDYWHTEDPGTDSALTAVAGLDDGTVCAVGAGGVAALRTAAGWTTMLAAGGRELHRVHAAAGGFLAAGDAGALVRIQDLSAELMEPPHDGDLRDLHVRGDSLFVVDGTSDLHVLVEGQWSAEQPGRLAGKSVVSLGTLPDGRLVALADSLYVRDETGWHCPPFRSVWDHWDEGFVRLETVGEALWCLNELRGGYHVRFDLEPDGWSSWGSNDLVAPRDRSRTLMFNDSRILWYDTDGPDRYDPAGASGRPILGRFLDDSCALLTDDRPPEYVTAEGTRPTGIEIDPLFNRPGCAAGRSLSDFYYLNSWEDVVHVVDGTSQILAYDVTDYVNPRMVALPDGDVLIFTSDPRVMRCHPGGVDTLALEGPGLRPYAVGPAGHVIVTRSGMDDAFVLLGETLTPTPLDRGFKAASFLPDGRALLLAEEPRIDGVNLGSGWWVVVYDPVTGGLDTRAKPLPVDCAELRIIGGVTAPGGFYTWSSNAGMVFRLAGDPALHDWELVAGPLDDEIVDLAVQPDGSLVVIAPDGRVYWYPGRP